MARERTLKVNIVGDTKSLNRALGNTSGGLAKLGKAGTVAGAGVAAGLGAAVKSAMSFESAFAGVRKTVDATEKEYTKLSKGLRAMSKEIPVAATELARVAEAAGQLGIEKKSILGFTRTMADLGVTTNLSSDEAATALARLANITKMPQSEFDRLGSTVVALGNKLASTEAEIVEMGLRLAGSGKQVGMTEDQILSFAGALSSVGINAEAGGSAFSKVFVDMAVAVDKGGKDLGTLAKTAGVSSSAFKKSFETDAAGATISFIEGLGKMKAQGGDVFGTLESLGFSGIRIRDSLLRASGAGDLFRKSMEIGSKAWKENNALTKEAEQRYATTESKLKILRNVFNDVGIVIGSKVLPPLAAGAQKLAGFVKEMQDGTGAGGQFARIMASVGAAIYGVGKFVVDSRREILALATAFGTFKILTWVVAGFKALRAGLIGTMVVSKLVPAFWALNAAMTANPIGLVVVGLSALAGGLVYAYTKSKTFREVVSGAFTVVRQIAAGAFDVITFGLRQFLVGIGKIAGAASNVPGMGWLKGVSREALAAAAKLKDVGDAIRGVPNKKKTSVEVQVKFKGLGALLDKPDSLSKTAPVPLGDAIGKAVTSRVPRSISVAAPSGGLKGANRALAPVASIGAGFGLSVSSGLRPGAITSSGNPSYHGTGEAVDLAGPPNAMMRAFRALKQTFGRRLAELIYTPGGMGIRNGRPHRYTGAVAADHYDHIHAALDLGTPGPGIGHAGPYSSRARGDGEGKGEFSGGRAAIIAAAAGKYGISPAILWGLYGAESNFGKNLGPSSAGARGPFQFMPATAKSLGINPMDFKSAAYGAARYLSQFKSRGTAGMLAAYNAGPAGNPNNPETQAYIPKVLQLARTYPGVGGGGRGGGASRAGVESKLESNLDKLDKLRNQLAQVPRGKAGAARRKALQSQIRALVSSNRSLRGTLRDLPTDSEAGERQEQAGSRAISRIANRALKGVGKDRTAQSAIGGVIEDAEGGYGRSERFFGQVKGGRPGDYGEEDLGTAAGRADRISELGELKKLKVAQLARMRKRLAALKRLIDKYEKALKKMNKARAKARGKKRAGMSERIKDYDDRLSDYKAEYRALGGSISDTELDIGDLTKDIQEVGATPDTGPDALSATDKLSGIMARIDAQERAGDLTPQRAQEARIQMLQQALGGAFGALTEDERLGIRGDLREAMSAQTQAIVDNTSALRDLQASVDANTAFANQVSAVTAREAVAALASMISGELGPRVAARQLMPGSGSLSRL